MCLVICVQSEEGTFEIGRIIGEYAEAGDVVCLIGDLGAGKTVLTQGIGAGLGLPARATVNSPTYTIVAERPGGRLPLYHFDLYRIKSSLDLVEIAADDYLEGDGICVVEWADLALEALGQNLLLIDIKFGAQADDRVLSITTTGPNPSLLLQAIAGTRRHP